MPKTLPPIRLRVSDRRELCRLVRSKQSSAAMGFRAGIVLMASRGASNADIARHFDCKPHIIKVWRDRWEAEGIEGLADRHRPGRPAKMNASLKQKIVTRACRKPPKHLGRWSVRTLADSLGLDFKAVHRVLQEHDLKLHHLRSFTFSPDPHFEGKLLDVVGLYMNPPENAVVLCVDEKTGIQALDRTQPMLPLKAKKPRAWTNEYVRHGTRTMLACLDVQSGEVIAEVRKRRTSKDFLSFMVTVIDDYGDRRLYIVLDNLNTHTNEAACRWLQKHPNVTFHFTPTHSSWVNLVECFFSILTRQGLQQKAFRSVRELESFLDEFVREYNFRCGPFEWTAGPQKLEKIIRLTHKFQNA